MGACFDVTVFADAVCRLGAWNWPNDHCAATQASARKEDSVGIELEPKPKPQTKPNAAAEALPSWKKAVRPGSNYAEAREALSPNGKPTLGAHRGSAPSGPTSAPASGVRIGGHRERQSPVATTTGAVASGVGPATSQAHGVASGTTKAQVPQAGEIIAGSQAKTTELNRAASQSPSGSANSHGAIEAKGRFEGGAQPQQTKKGNKFMAMAQLLTKASEPTSGPKSQRPEDYTDPHVWAAVLVPDDDRQYRSIVENLRHKHRDNGTVGSINAAWEAGQARLELAKERWAKHPDHAKRQVI